MPGRVDGIVPVVGEKILAKLCDACDGWLYYSPKEVEPTHCPDCGTVYHVASENGVYVIDSIGTGSGPWRLERE